ncbi:PAP2 family protein [Pleurocapsa sp. CCALA 161]|uniref:phosphatase PAP2 family protein n=1 Tax=Pleurocapsa sp. CCALA 161 TaxID=2107688 RepID=UPI000D062DE5|nr:phosphatase PAP2 family protein [Pleurocapsa sp. CCALA 161]PSB10764.1 PAP2 family protein [Pleurocapsa sp. CCALA 161]
MPKSKYPKISRNNLYLLLLLLFPFVLLCYQTFNKNYYPLDLHTLEFLGNLRNFWLDFIFTNVYRISNTYVTGTIVLIALITLIRQRYWSEVKALVFATLGILILVDKVLKPFFDRDRPPKPRLVSDLSPDSFPSGHAAGNLVFYFYISFIIAARYPHLAKYVYGVATCLVLLIGFSSVYVKAHWTTDIWGGYFFGYCWLLISLNLLKFLNHRQIKPE